MGGVFSYCADVCGAVMFVVFICVSLVGRLVCGYMFFDNNVDDICDGLMMVWVYENTFPMG